MEWLFFSLTAAFLWALVTMVDKVAIERYVPSSLVYLLFTGLTTFFVVIAFGLFATIEHSPLELVLLSMFTGFLFLSATYMYFASLEISDAPVVTSLLLLVPVFSTAIGFFFFAEQFAYYTYLGIAAVIVGSLLVSIEEEKSEQANDSATGLTRKLTAALGLMLLYAILASIDYALQKYLLKTVSENTFFFWARVGDTLFAAFLLFILPKARSDFISTLRSIPRIMLPISFGNELLNLGATYLVVLAYASGPLALVTTALSAQPVFVLLLVPIVNALRKGFIPHKGAGPRIFLLRTLAIGITLVGVYLISLGTGK